LLWFFVVGTMIRAIIIHQILWPQKGEDRDEGGFKDKKIGGANRDEKSTPV
jgi:hypothetical protein